MAIKVKKNNRDKCLRQLVGVLEEFDKRHPKSEIDAYRYSDVSVRVRIVSPHFKGQSRAEREEEIWELLSHIPEDVVAELSLLLLLAPEEKAKSLANFEFENPTPLEV